MDNNDKPGTDSSTPVFKSSDILKTKAHNQTEFFVNVKEERQSLKDKLISAEKGKRAEKLSDKFKKLLTKKNLIIAAVVLVIIIAGIFCAIYFTSHHNADITDDEESTPALTALSEKVGQYITSSASVVDVTALEQEIKNLINTTEDSDEQLSAEFMLVDLYMTEGSFGDAVNLLKEILEIDGLGSMYYHSALANLADAYIELDEIDLAKDALNKILRMTELDSPYESLEVVQGFAREQLAKLEADEDEEE